MRAPGAGGRPRAPNVRAAPAAETPHTPSPSPVAGVPAARHQQRQGRGYPGTLASPYCSVMIMTVSPRSSVLMSFSMPASSFSIPSFVRRFTSESTLSGSFW